MSFATAARKLLDGFVGRPLRNVAALRAEMEAGMLRLLVEHNILLDESGLTIRSDLGSIRINQFMVEVAAGRKACTPTRTEGVLSPEKPMFKTRNEVLKYLETTGELMTPSLIDNGGKVSSPAVRYRWDPVNGPMALAADQTVWNITKVSQLPSRFQVAPRRWGPWVEVKKDTEAAHCGYSLDGSDLRAAVSGSTYGKGKWSQAGLVELCGNAVWVKYEPETK